MGHLKITFLLNEISLKEQDPSIYRNESEFRISAICLSLICSVCPHWELVSWQDTTTINRLVSERSCLRQKFAFNLLLTKTDHHLHRFANYYYYWNHYYYYCSQLHYSNNKKNVGVNQKPPTKHFEINFKAMEKFSLEAIFLKKCRNQCNKSTRTMNNRMPCQIVRDRHTKANEF